MTGCATGHFAEQFVPAVLGRAGRGSFGPMVESEGGCASSLHSLSDTSSAPPYVLKCYYLQTISRWSIPSGRGLVTVEVLWLTDPDLWEPWVSDRPGRPGPRPSDRSRS